MMQCNRQGEFPRNPLIYWRSSLCGKDEERVRVRGFGSFSSTLFWRRGYRGAAKEGKRKRQ